MFFETSIKVQRVQENGTMKTATERYIFEAVSFADAEQRTIEEFGGEGVSLSEVKSNKKTKYSEVMGPVSGDAYPYWHAIVEFISVDEKSGSEKRTPEHILICADSIFNAIDIIMAALKGTAADYELVSMQKTAILDVFHLGEGNNPK